MNIVDKKIEVKFLSGSGNLFSVINNIDIKETIQFYTTNISRLCFDTVTEQTMEGLIVINSDNEHDFSVWFFNPDGTSGMMCGNGGRCAIFYYINYIIKNYKDNKLLKFSMNGTTYSGSANNDSISIYFAPPAKLPISKTICVNGVTYEGYFVDVGSPHWIMNVGQFATKKIHDIDIINIGREIRHHKAFFPGGTNVNFFQIANENTVYLRTYERGVENETGACGTGSIATALVCYQLDMFRNSLNIMPLSQSLLSIELIFLSKLDKNLSNLEQIILSGKVSLLN